MTEEGMEKVITYLGCVDELKVYNGEIVTEVEQAKQLLRTEWEESCSGILKRVIPKVFGKRHGVETNYLQSRLIASLHWEQDKLIRVDTHLKNGQIKTRYIKEN